MTGPKHVILIGDSIRHGYKDIVARELAGIAEVWSPEANCRDSVSVLVGLHGWVLTRPANVVHVNCGLHDLKTIVYDGRDNVVPVEYYRRNVWQILKTLRDHTQAKVIWATTTPVIQARAHAAHAGSRDFDRYEDDVVAYNQAAMQTSRELGVPVNDLYSVVTNGGKDRLLRPDGVHFTPEGCELL